MTKPETTSTLLHARIKEKLCSLAQRHGCSIYQTLTRAEEIACILRYHPDLGMGWKEKFIALLTAAQAANDKLGGPDGES